MAQKATTQTSAPTAATTLLPEKIEPGLLPQYKVILHNDDENDFQHVIVTLVMLCGFNSHEALIRTLEAHESGCALLLVTHKERAELFVDQFHARRLTVTIEPAD